MIASDQAVLASAQRLIKRPHESIKWASEVLEAPPEQVEDLPESNRVQQTIQSRRYLAVVVNSQTGIEEGAVVVFRRPQSPLCTRVIPIVSTFSLAISQKKANHSPTSARERSRFRVTFSTSATSFTLVTEDIAPFANLISEVKRLLEIAKGHKYTEGSGLTHAWLERFPEEPAGSSSSSSGGSAPPTPTRTSISEAKESRGPLDEEALARFHSISSAYSMRMASLRISAPAALRAGLSSIDWTTPSPTTSRDPSTLQARADDIANDARSKWMIQQIQEREGLFTTKEQIKVFVGTFNVNDKLPQAADLSPWLEGAEGAELLVFGFQEFDLSTEAMVRYTSWREDQWRISIEKALGPRVELYEKLHSRQLVGALILIYVLKSERKHIGAIQSNSIATGILGLMANKGATAIRLRYKDSFLTFINSHLSAFTNMVEKRNQETRDIAKGLGFPYDGEGKTKDPWTPNLKPGLERPLGQLGIYDSHQLVWLGDLNYRIELPRSDVSRMLEKSEWDLLMRFDQLKIQKQHALAWTDFEEAPITFPPTYKYDVGTSDYDTSEKQRTPSWTDRILWLSVHDGSIKCEAYQSHPEVTLSDHKPVSAVLQMQILTIIPEKRLEIQQEVMSALDGYDNDHLPDVKILPGPAVQFDTIDYSVAASQEIEVKNVGRVIAQWSFVLKPDATELSERWLNINPTSGLILPGEKSVVKLTINVDNATAPELNFSTDQNRLSDLLVLSIEKKDLFLSVSAREYLPTCFANTLSRLSKLGKAIRTASAEELDSIREGEGEEKGSVPHEIYRMLGFLAEHGVELEDVFLVPGEQSIVSLVRECLDTGDDFPLDILAPSGPHTFNHSATTVPQPTEPLDADIGGAPLSPVRPRTPLPPPPSSITSSTPITGDEDQAIGIHSMADCFIRFLESLPEPVVPFSAYPKALRAELRADAYRVVDSLPAVNANTLLYIVAFLRVILDRTTDVKERAARMDRLAVVFSSVLMRADPTAEPDVLPPATLPRRRKAFVLHLLSAEEIPPQQVGESEK
ncbi:DNase I-like protein [Meredithblackwellia eburnea MCA 4105]